MVGWGGNSGIQAADRSQSLIFELFLLPATAVILVLCTLERVVGPDMFEQEALAGVFNVGTPCLGEL